MKSVSDSDDESFKVVMNSQSDVKIAITAMYDEMEIGQKLCVKFVVCGCQHFSNKMFMFYFNFWNAMM